MDITLNQEQLSLRDSARQLLKSMDGWERGTDDFDGSASQAWWERIVDTGYLGIGVPEDFGGPGGSLFELGIVFRELGQVVAPSRFRSAAAGRFAYDLLASTEQRKVLLPDLAESRVVATVAFAEAGARRDPRAITTVARREGSGWALSGRKALVPDVQVSDLVIVAAQDDSCGDAIGYFAVDRRAPGLTVIPRRMFSGDPYFDLVLDDVHVDQNARLGDPDTNSHDRYVQAAEASSVLVALEAIGGTEAALARTVDHVATRKQFGVPIGGFQAMQHHLANIVIGLTGANLAAWKAASTPTTHAIAIAKAVACRNFKDATITCHQALGGIGVTEEFFLLRYSARAKLLEQIGGGWDTQLATIADGLGL